MTKEENIGNIGNIGSPKTRKYRQKYRDNIDIDKNYMETTEIVRKTWKFLLKLCRMFIQSIIYQFITKNWKEMHCMMDLTDLS